MRLLRRAMCVAALSMVMALPLGAQSADEDAVRDLVKRYVDARNRSDAKALEALFLPEADQLVSSGEWRKGRDAVVKGSLASSAGGGRRDIVVESVRVVGSNVAIADSRYEIAGADGGAPRRMWATWLVARTPEGWRIAAIRNMLPAAPASAR